MQEDETATTSLMPTRDGSAESANIPVKRRRKRRTAACVQCRSRKLKCDQEFPTCGRCAKGPRPSECTYQDASQQQQPTGSSSTSSQPPVASWGTSATVRVPGRNGGASIPRERPSAQLNQVQSNTGGSAINGDEQSKCTSTSRLNQHFEQHLDFYPSPKRRKTFGSGTAGAGVNLLEDEDPYVRDYRPQRLEIPSKTFWRGKECSSRFYGSSIIVNMISEFPELKAYAKEIKAENPVLTKFRCDLMAVKERNHHQKHFAEKTPPSSIDNTYLLNLLPNRSIVDELVEDYLTYIEPTHRIFHIPSLRRELETVWDQQPADIEPTILVQLVLMLATAWNLHNPGSIIIDEKPVTCDTAKKWIRDCEAWLQNSCTKRPNPVILRIRCLIIIAKNSNATRKSQQWTEIGSLVKFAMSAGYHREPNSQFAKISSFNREMRRRIWVTMVELDLQSSLDRGMPPTVRQDEFDCAMPANVNDEDIKEEEELPQSLPSNVATDSSFQVALARSLPLRLKICALVNAPTIRVSYEDLHWLEGEVMRYLSHVPDWQPPIGTSPKPQQRQQFLLWRTLIETKLEQTLLSLLSSVTPEASMSFAQSSRTRLEIATNILCQQQRLLSDINDSGNSNGFADSKLATLYPLTIAPLQAALVICHHLYTMDTGYTSKTIHAYLPSLPLSLLSLVEKTLSCLEPRTVLLEKGLKEYYILSMIVGLVKTKTAASDAASAAAATYRKEAVDKAAVLGYRVLAKKREKYGGDLGAWDANCPHYQKKNKKDKYAQRYEHLQEEQQQAQPPKPPSQNLNNMTTTPISMEETPPSLENLPTGTGDGTAALDNLQMPSLPQNFNFDFDFDWDFLLLDDADVPIGLGLSSAMGGNAAYPGQNLGGDGFGNFY
ncbi:hypothetical protein FQN54_002869 [Arachnomyces sp. PD_36]|nr:hypothetical protein FQN54_002869 [Arachnomyces sp. PD_36]